MIVSKRLFVFSGSFYTYFHQHEKNIQWKCREDCVNKGCGCRYVVGLWFRCIYCIWNRHQKDMRLDFLHKSIWTILGQQLTGSGGFVTCAINQRKRESSFTILHLNSDSPIKLNDQNGFPQLLIEWATKHYSVAVSCSSSIINALSQLMPHSHLTLAKTQSIS